MKERETHMVMRIAERVKFSVEEFRPNVPLMVALKKDGMRDRHWELVSASVGFRVHPRDRKEFCFQHVIDMGLLEHTEKCVQIGEQASKEF